MGLTMPPRVHVGGTATSHYRDYCPDAISLDTLFRENRNKD